jgi:hypothetical protein
MATTMTNGRPARPTLATQIDRLDRLLDGLSENLSEAVADAVKAAVVQAVNTVLTEVLTNPEVLAKLRAALPPATPAAQPVATRVRGPRLKERLAKAWSWLGAKVRAVLGACQTGINWLGDGAARVKDRVRKTGQPFWLRLRLLRHFRGQLLLALGVGVAAGVAAFVAAPWVAAMLSGLGGFMTAVVVQGGVVLLRLAAVSYQPRS